MNSSIAISKQIREKYGITLQSDPYYYITSAATVQIFLIVSDRVRSAVRDYLEIMNAQLEVYKTQLYLKINKFDVVSLGISEVIGQLDIILLPVENFLKLFPVDSIMDTAVEEGTLTEPPGETRQALSSFLGNIAGINPIKIPYSVVSYINGLGFDSVDFFSNVHTFKDLKDKIKILGFKLARASSISNTAATGVDYCEKKLQENKIYLDILNLIG